MPVLTLSVGNSDEIEKRLLAVLLSASGLFEIGWQVVQTEAGSFHLPPIASGKMCSSESASTVCRQYMQTPSALYRRVGIKVVGAMVRRKVKAPA